MPAMRMSRPRDCGADRLFVSVVERKARHGAERAPQKRSPRVDAGLGFTAAAPKRWSMRMFGLFASCT